MLRAGVATALRQADQYDRRVQADHHNHQKPQRIGVAPRHRAADEMGEGVEQARQQKQTAISEACKPGTARSDVKAACYGEQHEILEIVAMRTADAGDDR